MEVSSYSPVYALSVIGGKWKMPLLWILSEHGKLRYSQIRAQLAISHRVLSRQLDELEADGLILRILHPVVPPKVEYELTELGKRTLPAICAMCELGTILKPELAKKACGHSPKKNDIYQKNKPLGFYASKSS